MRSLSWCWLLLLLGIATRTHAADEPTYLLAAEIQEHGSARVAVTLDVGGDLVVTEESGTKSLPLTVKGELRYLEQMLSWSADKQGTARSLRRYETAEAKIQVDEAGLQRELPASRRLIIADLNEGLSTLSSEASTLTRDEFDLISVVGNSLVLNRLLPDRELAEGENWKHDVDTMKALLGMDHIAVCEVSSVVTGYENRQVQIRLAGTVHGTVDGAPSEMQLRGAYLFHEVHQRITKFNLAIKEVRTANLVVPGLDVVAKVSVTVTPLPAEPSFDLIESFGKSARDLEQPVENTLRYEAAKKGYRFLHDPIWYVTAEQSDLVSLRSLQGSNPTAHCNITTLPARSAGRETTLEVFEKDVRETLGDNLKTVSAATEWDTPQGNHCLGVIGQGKVDEVPIEWRYYLIAAPNKPRVSLAFTIEQSQLETFNDADRQLVDTLELLESPATARKSNNETQR